jgi:hypothetical protein
MSRISRVLFTLVFVVAIWMGLVLMFSLPPSTVAPPYAVRIAHNTWEQL